LGWVAGEDRLERCEELFVFDLAGDDGPDRGQVPVEVRVLRL
jgi:hypothetical protein